MSFPLLRTFSFHYRQKYGHGVGKIPVDMGRPCPNRQWGGCIFCRAAGFTPAYLNKADELTDQVAAGKRHLLRGRFTSYFAYFQQETCTAVAVEELLPAFESLLTDADCIGLILSTRPDYVSDQLLERLAALVDKTGKECLFELGLQSRHERSLQWLNRRHTFADFADAARRITAPGCFELGAHLIFGIPGESRRDMLETVRSVCALGVHALKLHHLQVIRDTRLEILYARGNITLFAMADYIDFLLQALPIIPSDVAIHRLWATAHPELLVAPRWNILAGELSEILRRKMVAAGVRQGQAAH